MLYLILQEVLSKHPESINTRDKDGATAEILLDRGVEVNARTTNEIQAPFGSAGQTPLHWSGADVAELLIAKGADINVKDANGSTPLSLAISKKNEEIINLLKKHGAVE